MAVSRECGRIYVYIHIYIYTYMMRRSFPAARETLKRYGLGFRVPMGMSRLKGASIVRCSSRDFGKCNVRTHEARYIGMHVHTRYHADAC